MDDLIKKCLPTYEVIRKIGEGVYGTVFHVRDNLKDRAVKVVPIMIERSLSYRTQKELDSKISHDFHAVQAYYGKIKGCSSLGSHYIYCSVHRFFRTLRISSSPGCDCSKQGKESQVQNE